MTKAKIALALAFVLATALVQADLINFYGPLLGPTVATGYGAIVVDTTQGTLTVDVVITNAPATAIILCHVHYSPIGPTGSGNPIYNMTASNAGGCNNQTVFTLNTGNLTGTAPTDDLTNLQAGNYYINVHTVAYNNGELRANLASYLPTFTAPLVGSTQAQGYAAVTIAGSTMTVDVVITVPPTTAIIMCHIHYSPNGPSGSGNPIYNMTSGIGGGCNGQTTFTVDSATATGGLEGEPIYGDLVNLLFGNYYINVHTVAYNNGELRANLVTSSPKFGGPLQPAAYGVSTVATGYSVVSISGSQLTVDVIITTPPTTPIILCHIHYSPNGPSGSGDPIYNMTAGIGGGCNLQTTFTIDSANLGGDPSTGDLYNLLAGNYYVNVHTAAYLAGEIRSDLFAFAPVFSGPLNPSVPNITTTITGTSSVYIAPDGNLAVAVEIVTPPQTPIILCHIHYSPTGPSGSGNPIYNMTTNSNGGCNTFTIFGIDSGTLSGASPTNGDLVNLIQGNYYVNVHTAANTNGEVRANLSSFSPPAFFGPLAPVTNGTGAGTAGVAVIGNQLYVGVNITTLPTTPVVLCHIHYSPNGPTGSGDPIYNMTDPIKGGCRPFTIFNINSGLLSGYLPTGGDIENLIQGNYYINVHTVEFPTGELRANLGGYYGPVPFNLPALPPVFSTPTPSPTPIATQTATSTPIATQTATPTPNPSNPTTAPPTPTHSAASIVQVSAVTIVCMFFAVVLSLF